MYKVQEHKNIKYFILDCSFYPLPSCESSAAFTVSHGVSFLRNLSRVLNLKKIYLFGCARSQLWPVGPFPWEILAVAYGAQFPDKGLNSGPYNESAASQPLDQERCPRMSFMQTQATMNICFFFILYGGASGKELTCQCRRQKRLGSVSGFGRSSGEGNGNSV